ncbi:hypothetical protein LCGC14_2304590 [marine sediment metagenome]|uniref:Uncharacterized protein n=1 Tax=marine sediment metagenome TaxID=412755 RepID=A0A0F9FHD9_9ZZZZ
MKMYNTRGALITSNEGNLRSYDTGWIACSDWTDQHLGSAVGGNVVHNLNSPLRNLIVKVFISTDGTDANSHEVGYSMIDNAGAIAQTLGLCVYAVDDNNLIIQTGSTGLYYIDAAGGWHAVGGANSEYYRIVVYEMTSVYSGVAMDMYETPWINRSDWTNVHLGSNTSKNVDSNVTHNLNAPLGHLLVKVLISDDGVDANRMEIVGSEIEAADRGINIHYVDANNILIQTGNTGIAFIQANGTLGQIDTENWYYKIVVYKLTAQPPAITTSRVRVTKDDAQTMTDNTPEAVEYDDVDFDSLGEWDISTWKFTAKNAGYYQINACVLTSDAIWTLGDLVHLSLWKNGARFSYLDRKELLANTENVLASGSDIVYLNGTTDYIQIYCWINRGANTDLINNALFNYVSIHRS